MFNLFAQLIARLLATVYTQYWSYVMSDMNSEEKVQVVFISGLRVGRNVKEIIKITILKRTTVYDFKRRYDDLIAARGLPEDFSSQRESHSRRCDAMDVNMPPPVRPCQPRFREVSEIAGKGSQHQ